MFKIFTLIEVKNEAFMIFVFYSLRYLKKKAWQNFKWINILNIIIASNGGW